MKANTWTGHDRRMESTPPCGALSDLAHVQLMTGHIRVTSLHSALIPTTLCTKKCMASIVVSGRGCQCVDQHEAPRGGGAVDRLHVSQ